MLLADAIADIHARSRGTYGMLRIRAALEIEQGLIVNKKLVWKIMRQLGLKGLPGPRKGVKNLKNAPPVRTSSSVASWQRRRTSCGSPTSPNTTPPKASSTAAPCSTCSPARSWARLSTDDATRRWSTTPSPKQPVRAPGQAAVIHSDHGSQFTSWAFTENVRRLGLTSSMGTVGDCYDNAPMESFWGSVQIELFNRRKWRTKIELAVAIADYIEHFYNSARRHSALGYLTPTEFEDLQSPQPVARLS